MQDTTDSIRSNLIGIADPEKRLQSSSQRFKPEYKSDIFAEKLVYWTSSMHSIEMTRRTISLTLSNYGYFHL